MSKYRKWLTGAEVMERLNIAQLDLLGLIDQGKLRPHHPVTGKWVCLVYELPRSFHYRYFAGHQNKVLQSYFEKALPELKKATTDEQDILKRYSLKLEPPEYEPLYLPPDEPMTRPCKFMAKPEVANCMFLKCAVEELKSLRDIGEGRKIAQDMWAKNPNLTVREVGESIWGKGHHMNTYRNYLKGLHPNPKGGRPSKKD